MTPLSGHPCYVRLSVLATFCCLLAQWSPAHAELAVKVSDNGPNVGRFDIYEITMAHEGVYANPWQDVKITTVFTRETAATAPAASCPADKGDAKTFTVGGFYYDTGTWKLRFVPMKTGVWTWKLTFAAGNDSYSATGRFTCIDSTNPGFMRICPKNPYRFVTEAEGKPFHPVGLGGPSMNPPDQVHMDGLWGGKRITLQRYCDTLASSGVNLFRFNSTKWGKGWTAGADAKGRRTFDVETGKIADRSLQQFHDSKIQIMMVLLPGNPDNKTPARDIEYFSYGINRWGAYVSVWELMNEVFSGRPTTPEWYAALCPFIRDNDPYSHPITISFPDRNSIGKDSKGRDYLDITSPHLYLGYGPGNDRSIVSTKAEPKGGGVQECKAAYPNKPIIFGEFGNTYRQVYAPRNYSLGLFVTFFNEATPVFWQAGVKKTKQVCIYYGVIERGMSNTFASYLGDFDPAAAIVTPAPAIAPAHQSLRVYALRGSNEYAAYLHYMPNGTIPETASGKKITVDVPADNLTAMWITTHGGSSESGKVGELLEARTVKAGQQTLAVPDFDSGILLLIRPLDTSKPILQFKACGHYMPENCGKAVIEVQRLGSAAGAVSVKYSTADNTAIAAVDYTAATGTLTWADGDTSAKTISIPIVNRPDTMDDYDRGFQVTLSDPAGGAVLGPARTAIVGILGLSAGKAGTTKPADMEDAPPAMGR